MSDGNGFTPQAGRWVLVAAVLAMGMAFIDATALNVALPALQISLAATGPDLFWILNAYALPLTSFLLLAGALGDRYGRKRVFRLGIAGFAIASLACGFAPTPGTLIAARVAQGIGGAAMIPGSLALITAVFPPSQRGRAIGVWSAMSVITMALGPVLGGVLAQAGLWRGVFFINIPLAAVALVALHSKVPESRDPHAPKRLDLRAAFLAVAGLAGISYACIEAPQRGLASARIWGPAAGGISCLVLFVLAEVRSRTPMLPMAMFRSRTFLFANLMTLSLYTAFYGMMVFIPLNLVQVQGYSAGTAGLALVPVILFIIILSPWAGRIVDVRGPRGVLLVGSGLAGLGLLLLAVPGLTGGPPDYWATYALPLSVLGIGLGLTITPLSTTVMNSVSVDRVGLASGINSTLSRLASVLAIAVFGGVALLIFRQTLEGRIDEINVGAEVKEALMSTAVRLGEAVPDNLRGPPRAAAEAAVKLTFVDTFRLLSRLGAGLAWLGTLLALLGIRPGPLPDAPRDT